MRTPVANAAAATTEEEVSEELAGDAGVEDSGAPRKRWNGKRIVLVLVLPVFLLVGAGLGLVFTGVLDSVLGKSEEKAAVGKPNPNKPAVFHDLPEMLVNLNTTGSRATFLKITVSLELEKSDDIPRIKDLMPRVQDNFQIYLRELRLDDLRGSAGMYRLREELLARVNAAVAPVKVKDILFKEILVQ
jgi:flagellar FliL protein